MERPKHYFSLARSLLRVPTYLLILMYLIVGVLTGLAVSGMKPDNSQLAELLFKAFVCAIIIALWYINGAALNDYADYEIDIINLKGDSDRPLVAGTATPHELVTTAIFCGTVATIAAFVLQWQLGVVVIVLLLLNFTYSIKPIQISRRGGLAPVLLPLGYVFLPLFMGYRLSACPWHSLATVMVVGLYLQFMGRIILKDYRDVKGDKANGKMTFLLRHGNRAVCFISAMAITASSILLILCAGNYLQVFRYAILCLLGFSLVNLYQLSQTEKWKQQKPIIAAFGRSMTGITAAIILGLAVYIWPQKSTTTLYMAIVLIFVYIWSAQRAYAYNTEKLSKR